MPLLDVASAVLGALLLHAFYRVVENEWPQAYHSVQDLSRYTNSISPGRYFFFRFAPPALATFLVAGIAFRSQRNGWLPGILLIMIHAASTAGRAIVQGRLWREIKKPYFWSHVLIALLLVAFAIAACFVATLPDTWSVVPKFEDASTELWTALLAGLIAAFFVNVTRKREPDIEKIVSKTQQRLGPQLIGHARVISTLFGTDPLFVEAVMIVESLQRPRWFRVLENLVGPRLGARSYGVMQVPDSEPMSDAQSVVEAVAGYFPGFQVNRDPRGDPVF
jgi:hypothetical protein